MSQSSSAPNPAQVYEDFFVAHQFRPWTEVLLDRAQPRPGARVLDVGCGTAIVARLLAQRVNGDAIISGLDPSPVMLGVAREMSERERVGIEFHEGIAEDLPFRDETFDLITMQQCLQFFKDKLAALRHCHRVLVPGGRVVSSTWTEIEHNPFHLEFAEVLQRHLGTPAMHTPFALGNREELHSLFRDAGFDEIEIDVVDLTVRYPSTDRFVELGVAGISAAVPAMQSLSADERAELTQAVRADVAGPLDHFSDNGALLTPMQAHVVVAVK